MTMLILQIGIRVESTKQITNKKNIKTLNYHEKFKFTLTKTPLRASAGAVV